MSDLQSIVNDLVDSGLSEGGIADRLKSEFGVNVSQPTIHRIKSGKSRNPKFNTGEALKKLHSARQKELQSESAA